MFRGLGFRSSYWYSCHYNDNGIIIIMHIPTLEVIVTLDAPPASKVQESCFKCTTL